VCCCGWWGKPDGLRAVWVNPTDYALFGDSAYPQNVYLYRIYRGAMTVAQAAMNAIMSPLRVTVEWGFGKIVNLWPWLDYRTNQQILKRPIGLYLDVGNLLTNMHTCIYGSIISSRFKMYPPALELYMAGGRF